MAHGRFFLIKKLNLWCPNITFLQSAKYWQKFPRASERELAYLDFSASERARAGLFQIFGERAS